METDKVRSRQKGQKVKVCGRPKGAKLTTIGLPKKHVPNTKPTPFTKKYYITKENIIIEWLINKNVVDQIHRNNYKIGESDIKCEPNKICSGIFENDVDVNSIKQYCTESA
ncbi:hypothetical protein ACI65C_004647 [Semiaphis heraclei]